MCIMKTQALLDRQEVTSSLNAVVVTQVITSGSKEMKNKFLILPMIPCT